MADMLAYPGSRRTAGVPAPYLQGAILPAGPPWTGRVALGMGQMTRRFADVYDGAGAQVLTPAQQQALVTAAAQAGGGAAAQVINLNLGLAGPPGPPGINTTQFVPMPWGLGQVGRYGEDGEDGADAFADIDIPIPYTGTATKWEDCFSNNSPGAGQVSWITFKVKYKGVEYTVAALPAGTDASIVYWNAADPTNLNGGTLAEATGSGKWIVGRNNAGTFEPTTFIKTIVSGFIQVNVLSALTADLGTVTAGEMIMNLGTTYRLKISPSGIQGSTNSGSSYFNIISLDGTDVLIQGTKIKALSVATGAINDLAVATGKIAASATKNWNTASGGNVSHTSEGGYIEVTGMGMLLASAFGDRNSTVSFYYNGQLIGTDTVDLPSGAANRTFSYSGLCTGTGSTAWNFTINSGPAGTPGLVLYNRTMEDKGK